MIAHLMVAISGSFALSFLMKATVVLVCIHVVSAVAMRSSAASRHVILTAGFGAVLLLPIVSVTLPIVPIGLTVTQSIANNASTGTIPPLEIGTRAAEVFRAPSDAGQDPSVRPQVSIALVALGVWVAGIVLNLAPVLLGLLESRRFRRNSLPWHASVSVREIVARSGLRRVIALRCHRDVRGPMTFGVLHPVILCPPTVATWPEEDLARAMTHEIEHVRRYDWLTLTLARLICAGLWFHPLVWSAWRRMRLEAERACDDAVLRDAEPTAYAEQLVALARGMTRSLPFLAMACRDDLSARVRALLDARRARGRAGAGRVVGVVVLTIPIVALFGAVRGVAIAQSDVAAPRPEFSVVNAAAPGALVAPNPNQLRVQTNLRRTEWAIYGTEHFELFHPADLTASVTAIGEDAERAYRQIATDLGHDLIMRVPIVLIDAPSDVPGASTNFGPPFGDARADRMFLPLDRPEQVAGLLRHELTHVFAFEMLPPGASNVTVPTWGYEGLAEHERGGWTTADEGVVRDAIRADAVPKLALGEPVSAGESRFVIAHAFFDFLQTEYGKAGIRQLLSAFGRPGARDVYADAVGVDADAVDRQFQRYVRLRFEQ